MKKTNSKIHGTGQDSEEEDDLVILHHGLWLSVADDCDGNHNAREKQIKCTQTT